MRHVTSGRYLACTEDNNVVTFHRTVATEEATAFLLRQSKVCNADLSIIISFPKNLISTCVLLIALNNKEMRCNFTAITNISLSLMIVKLVHSIQRNHF